MARRLVRTLARRAAQVLVVAAGLVLGGLALELLHAWLNEVTVARFHDQLDTDAGYPLIWDYA